MQTARTSCMAKSPSTASRSVSLPKLTSFRMSAKLTMHIPVPPALQLTLELTGEEPEAALLSEMQHVVDSLHGNTACISGGAGGECRPAVCVRGLS